MGTPKPNGNRENVKPDLKLLFVDTETVWRGGQEQICSLISGMLKRGHRAWLAAPRSSPLADRASASGAVLLPLRQRFELSPLSIWRLFRFMRGQRFDIVHFNSQRALLAGGLAARLSGAPPFLVCSRRVNFPLRTRFSHLKFNLFMDRVVTVSASIRDTLMENGVDPFLLQVIYEGRDLESIDAMPDPTEAFGESRPVIGIVAHLSEEKGHSTLIRAIALLLNTHPGLTLLIVGEGRLRNRLQQLVKRLGVTESVRFLGFREDADSVMRCFDIFCLPSLCEGLGSVILAAMANRLPIVSCAVGGIPELVIDRETGLLVPPGDPQRLAQALQELLESPGLRQRMGESGRQRVEARFTLEKNIRDTEQLYWKLLGKLPIK